MLGVKVELNATSVAETKRKFNELLTTLQDRANKTTIKINIDFANLRQLNGIMNTVIGDMKRLDSQNKQTANSMTQIANSMRSVARMQQQLNGNSGNNNSHGGNNFGIGNLAEWLILRKGIQAVMTELREGITFAFNMNKAMTEISIVTGKNQQAVGQLAGEYNNLAKAMAVSTEEIAKASVEYYRQGLSTEDVNERMEQTIQYAKVSGLALEEASTIMTATVNSMGVDIKRASDVFAYMGDATATGADEIGRGFQKVGGTASALGVEFEKVSSWIATVSSKTRESAETIGNSIKGLMARFQQIRETGFNEEDAVDTNQVTKALMSANIQAVDAQGQFRNFGVVMDELGKKWVGLDSRTKAYIATTLAGTHQQSRFLNLMQNYGDSIELYENSLESAGTTQQKYNLYLQGTEAHLNQLKATAEGIWLKIFNSEDMKTAIDTMTSLISGIGKIVSTFGLLPTVLGTVGSAFLVFSKNFKAVNLTSNGQGGTNISGFLSSAVNGIKNYKTNLESLYATQVATGQASSLMGLKFQALTGKTIAQSLATVGLTLKTMALNAVIGLGIGLAITGIITVITKWINKTNEAKQAQQELMVSLQQTGKDVKSLEDLNDKYKTLSENTNKTAEDLEKLRDIQSQIGEIVPSAVKEFDAEGKVLELNSDEIERNIKLKKDMMEANANLAQKSMSKTFDKDRELFEQNLARQKQLMQQINSGELKTIETSYVDADNNVQVLKTVETMDMLKKEFENVNKQVEDGKSKMQAWNTSAIVLNDTTNKGIAIVDLSTGKVKLQTDALNKNGDAMKKVSAITQITMAEAQKNFEGSTTKIEDYNKIVDELNDKGILSATSVNNIMKKHQELIPYLGNEAELRKKLAELTQNEEDVQRDAYSAMLQMSEQFYNEKIKGTSILENKLGEYYTKDLNDYKSLAQAKKAVDDQLISGLIKNWGNYFSVTDDVLNVDNRAYTDIVGEEGTLSRGRMSQLNRLGSDVTNAQAKLKDVADRFKSITLDLSPIDFDKINLAKTSKGGSTEKTVYESKLDGTDKYTAKLEDMNDTLSKQDNIISDINEKIKYYKSLGDENSLATALKLENDLYAEQSKRLDMLKTNMQGMTSEKSAISQAFRDNFSAMSGVDFSNWSKSQFTDMFENLFPTKTFTDKNQQEQYEQGKKLFNQLTDDYFKFGDSITKTNGDILSTQNDMLSTMRDKYDIYFGGIEGGFDKLKDKMSATKDDIDNLLPNEDGARSTLVNQLVSDGTSYRNSIQKTIVDLESSKSKLTENSDEWNIINDKVTEYKTLLRESNNELKNTKDLVMNEISRVLEKQIFDGMTQSEYERASQSRINATQNEIDALQEKWDLEDKEEDRKEKKKEISDLEAKETYLKANSIANLSEAKAKELGLEDERNKALEYQIDLEKLQEKLRNLKKQRTEQQMVQVGDNKWDFEYVANQKEIDEVQKDIQDKEDDYNEWRISELDKVQETLKEKRLSFAEWEEQNDRQNQIKELQNKIKAEQDKLKVMQQSFEDIKTLINTEYDPNNPNSVNAIIDKGLTGVDTLYDEKFKGIVETIRGRVGEASAELIKLQGLLSQITATNNTINNSSSGSSDLPKGSATELGTMFNGDFNHDTEVMNDYWETHSHARGTTSASGGLSLVGEEGAELKILNQGDGIISSNLTKNLMTLGEHAPEIMSSIMGGINMRSLNVSKLTGIGDRGTSIFIDKIELPNVTNDVGVDNLKYALSQLPRLAKMKG